MGEYRGLVRGAIAALTTLHRILKGCLPVSFKIHKALAFYSTVFKKKPNSGSLLARMAGLLVRFYQQYLSPLKTLFWGPYATCRFSPTCSQYAYDCLSRHGFCMGIFYTLRRILRCHPFHPGGEDPVPPTSLPAVPRRTPAQACPQTNKTDCVNG